jgi:hypothetical protein
MYFNEKPRREICHDGTRLSQALSSVALQQYAVTTTEIHFDRSTYPQPIIMAEAHCWGMDGEQNFPYIAWVLEMLTGFQTCRDRLKAYL